MALPTADPDALAVPDDVAVEEPDEPHAAREQTRKSAERRRMSLDLRWSGTELLRRGRSGRNPHGASDTLVYNLSPTWATTRTAKKYACEPTARRRGAEGRKLLAGEGELGAQMVELFAREPGKALGITAASRAYRPLSGKVLDKAWGLAARVL